MPIYSAGSASVKIVPDFAHAQQAVGEWFARQGDLHVKVKPDISDASLAETKAKIDGVEGTAKVKVDHNTLAESISGAIAEAAGSITGLNKLGGAVNAAIVPSMMTAVGGAAVELVGALSQALSLLYLMPAGILGLIAPLGTVLLGVNGVTAAFKVFSATTPAQLKQAQAALDKLAPSARDFVEQVHQLAPAFHDLKLDVQQQLFDGLGASVLHLGQVALPVAKTGLADIAGSINAGLLATIQQLLNDGPAFASIFTNIAGAIRTVSTGALPTLIQDFIQVGQIGSQFLPQLAQAVVVLTDRFDHWLQSGIQSGAIVRQIQQALQIVDVTANIVSHLAGGISSILSAALPFGDQLLGLLDQLTSQLETFLKAPETQSALIGFFNSVNQVASTLLPVIGQLLQVVIADLLPILGDLASAIAPVLGELGTQLVDVLEQVSKMLPPLADVVGELVSAFAPLIPMIGSLITTLLPTFLQIGHQLAPVIDALEKIIAGALVPAVQLLAPVLTQVGLAALQVLDALLPMLPPILQLASSLLPPLLKIVVALLPAFTGLAPMITAVVNGFLAFASPIITGLVNLLADTLVPVLTFLRPVLPEIAGAVLLWATWTKLLAAATAAWKIAEFLAFVVQYVIQVNLASAATKAWAIAQGIWAAVTNVGVYARLAGAIAAYIVQVDLVQAATKVWAGVQAALNFVMDANPIGLIIVAIGALVAAVVWVVTHWTTFKNVVVDVWHAIEDAAQFAWDHILHPVINALGDAVQAVWEHFLHPVFTAIADAWHAVASAVETVWNDVLHPIWNVIAGAAIILYRIVVVTVLGAIEGAWWLLSNGIKLAWNDLIKPAWEEMKEGAQILWRDVLKPVWDAIKTAWKALGDYFKYVNETLIQPVWNTIKQAFDLLWNGFLKPAWDGIKKAWQEVGDGFKWVNDNLIQPVWNGIKGAFDLLWYGYLKPAWDTIKKAWSDVGTWLKNVWNDVSGWLSRTWNTFKTDTAKIWQDITNGIKTAWKTVEDIVATPINFVIAYVFDKGLFAAWNWVVDHLGLPSGWHAPHWDQLPAGDHFDTGGYTGEGMFGTGGRLDPAGVVHAGEFVFDQDKTRRFRRLFEYLHAGGSLPGYDSGGLVVPPAVLAGLADPLNPAGEADAIYNWLKLSSNASGADTHARSSNFLSAIEAIPMHLLGWMWDKAKGLIGGFLHSAFVNATSVPNIPSSRSANVAIVQAAAKPYGWDTGNEWNALQYVVNRESGFNNMAQNPTSTAFGMFQFLDTTWGGYGLKTSDPTLQAKYGMEYIQRIYGEPSAAYAHEVAFGWYDDGGYLPPGWSSVYNGTGRPEPVLTAAQNDALMAAAGLGAGAGRAVAAQTIAGIVNHGQIVTFDVNELVRKDTQATRRVLAARGLAGVGRR